MRDAKIANKLIQLKIIIKSDIRTMKYYKKIAKLNSAQNVRIIIIEYIYVRTNNIAYIMRKNIVSQNIFIKKMH